MRTDARGDPRAALGVTEQRERDRRLARAGLTDEPDDLAALDRERDAVDDLLAAGASARPGGPTTSSALTGPAPRRSMPAIARAMPSVMKLVPIANSAMHSGRHDHRPRLERQDRAGSR